MNHTVQIPLRWGDADAYGHINNVAVLRLLEEARVRALWKDPATGRGVLPVLTPTEPIWSVVSEMHIRYIRPLAYAQAPVHVSVNVGRVTGASFDLHYEIRVGGATGATHVEATCTIVTVDAESGAPRRLSAHTRDALKSHPSPQ